MRMNVGFSLVVSKNMISIGNFEDGGVTIAGYPQIELSVEPFDQKWKLLTGQSNWGIEKWVDEIDSPIPDELDSKLASHHEPLLCSSWSELVFRFWLLSLILRKPSRSISSMSRRPENDGLHNGTD